MLDCFGVDCFRFQFTRPQGARRYAFASITEDELFQFTRPQGARL